MKSPRRSLLACAALALVACSAQAGPLSFSSRSIYLADSPGLDQGPYVAAHDRLRSARVQLQVVERDTARSFLMFSAGGDFYVGGEEGQPYALKLQNLTGERLLVVPSVDGINTITGQTASAQQSGYILPAFGELTVDGWRKSLNDVAEFVFTSRGASYAAQTGRPTDVGVIGLAVFREWREKPQPRWGTDMVRPMGAVAESREAPMAAAAPTAESSLGAAMPKNGLAQDPSLGTGHGERQASAAQYGEFRRESELPAEVLQVRYNSLRNLESMGIAQRRSLGYSQPRAFPADNFVPDPPRR